MANSHSSKQVMLSDSTGSKPVSDDDDFGTFWKKSSSEERAQVRVLHPDLNLDTHPVVARLQNEQNQRLEGMEQRIKKIRKNAQQEAERRKFAHLFRARAEDRSQTERLLREASLALQDINREKRLKKTTEKKCLSNSGFSSLTAEWTCQPETDKGDIIPVHVVPGKQTASAEITPQKHRPSKTQQPLMWLLQPVEIFQLDGIVLWLVLPFLLPVLLLLHMIRHFSTHMDTRNGKKN